MKQVSLGGRVTYRYRFAYWVYGPLVTLVSRNAERPRASREKSPASCHRADRLKKKQRVPRVGDKIVIRSSRHVIRRILPIMPATSRDACSIKAPSARGVRPVRLSRHTSILASGTDRESPKNSFEKLFVASSNFRTVDPLIVTPIIFMIPVGRTGRRG